MNQVASQLSAIFGKLLFIPLNRRFSTVRIQQIAVILQAIGALPIILSLQGSQEMQHIVVPVSLMFINFGNSSNFLALYCGHLMLFPKVFSSTTLGTVNVFARFTSVVSPIVAEIQQPVPAISIAILSIVATTASSFIVKKSDKFY